MKKKIVFFILIFIVQVAFPKGQISNVNGLHSVFLPEKSYLSPLHGCVAVESGWLDNVYRYAHGSKAQALVRHLFFIRFEADNVIKPTSLQTNVANYFDEGVIGTILGFLELHRGSVKVDLLSKFIEEQSSNLFYE